MLVDTNVLSQVTRPNGDPKVIDWIGANFDRLMIPSLVASELLYGAHKQADRRQRERLIAATETLLRRCEGKIVAFEAADAMLHGRLSGEAARAGGTRPASDSMIAAMAVIRELPVATRNVRHFAGLGLTIVDPWIA